MIRGGMHNVKNIPAQRNFIEKKNMVLEKECLQGAESAFLHAEEQKEERD